MGSFITFEGIEGSGKTTQMHLLRECLEKSGYSVEATREPGGTRIGDAIRRILLDANTAGIDTKTELLLYQAARAQHIHEVIRPALAQDRIVLCDRFTDATLAYQGYAQDIDLDLIGRLNQYASGDLIPDLTILIDCPVEIGLQRARNRMAAHHAPVREDRYEEKSLDFHQAVRLGYLQLAEKYSSRFYIVDGREDPASAHRSIQSAVLKMIAA